MQRWLEKQLRKPTKRVGSSSARTHEFEKGSSSTSTSCVPGRSFRLAN